MTKMLVASEIFRKCLVEEEVRELENSESESQYYCYDAGSGRRIYVESTASQIMEQLVRFSVYAQTRLFDGIAEAIPEPGDSVIIINDKEGKRRSAYVARLKSEHDHEIRL